MTTPRTTASEPREWNFPAARGAVRRPPNPRPCQGKRARVGRVGEARPEIGLQGLAIPAARRPPGIGDRSNVVVFCHLRFWSLLSMRVIRTGPRAAQAAPVTLQM